MQDAYHPAQFGQPDEVKESWLEKVFCPICDKEEVFAEYERGDDDITETSYWCDNCQKYIVPKEDEI